MDIMGEGTQVDVQIPFLVLPGELDNLMHVQMIFWLNAWRMYQIILEFLVNQGLHMQT